MAVAAAERSNPLGAIQEVLLERTEVVLELRSNGSARVYDTFGRDAKSPLALSDKKVDTVFMLRPLPVNMIRSSCIIRRTRVPVFAYRIDEPVWSVANSLSNAALGETLTVHGKKDQTWEGKCLHADSERVVIYDPKNNVTIVDRSHVAAVKIHGVPLNEAPHFAHAGVCLVHVKDPSKIPREIGGAFLELSYDLIPNALAFATHHVLAIDIRAGKLRVSSFVEVANNTGVHLMNAIVRVKQRQSDSAAARRRDEASVYERTEDDAVEERDRSLESKSYRRKMAMAAAPRGVVAESAGSVAEAVIEAQLNDGRSVLHLAPMTTTKISAFEANDVPATLRYIMRQERAASKGVFTLNMNQCADAQRAVTFLRKDLGADGASFLSGLAVVLNGNSGDEPLSEQPVYLDAWQNPDSGRMRLDLGTNPGVRWRAYGESEKFYEKENTTSYTCRFDVVVTPLAAGRVNFKFEAVAAQVGSGPEMLGDSYRRLPAGDTESAVEAASTGAFIKDKIQENDAVASKWWVPFGKSANFEPHDPEKDDQPKDHSRYDLSASFEITEADVDAYKRRRYPLVLSFYYAMSVKN